MPQRRGLPWCEIASALSACLAVALVAGGALRRGFPLDDAWIHMAYGLALVREGSLAYNQGAPATGCTSPLWGLVAALDEKGLQRASGRQERAEATEFT
jgi:hypothetical protein